MKLFIVVIVFALIASSVSGTFFGKKRKSSKVVDIHISKAHGNYPITHPIQPGVIPVGQTPVFVDEIAYAPAPQFDQSLTGGYQQSGSVNTVQHGIKTPSSASGSGGKYPYGQVVPGHSLNVPVIHQQHTYHVVHVPVNTPYFTPRLLTVEPHVQSVQLLFKSASSPLLVQQKHYGSPGATYQSTRSQDYPHVLRHEVLKPVLQEVREVIQPYRSVTQEFKPVLEQVHTIVPKAKYSNQAGFTQQTGAFQPLARPQGPQFHFPSFQHAFKKPPPPVKQEPISQEPIEQEPIEQEPIEQHPVKSV